MYNIEFTKKNLNILDNKPLIKIFYNVNNLTKNILNKIISLLV